MDGPDMEISTAAPWHSQQYFPPYRFYNVEEGMERAGYGKSIYNSAEAEAALALVDMLANRLPNIKVMKIIIYICCERKKCLCHRSFY